MTPLEWFRGLVGNATKATVLIGIFVLVLLLLWSRCARAVEIDLRPGMSFGPATGGNGPVLGLQAHWDQGEGYDLFAGTTLWGKTPNIDNNWDFDGGIRGCRWSFCAALGATYFVKTDRLNGSNLNFFLGLAYKIGWHRVSAIELQHASNAGTVMPNYGRNAAVVAIRLN